ncbi:MAG: hypothetical protein ACI9IP_002892 [Arcticibacterium sp.]|jgi:hypothetical protein
MIPNWKRYLENILFITSLLLAFLLLFESYIELPAWFQVFGRLHPLVLHFPIALLGLVYLALLFKPKWPVQNRGVYKVLVNNLLLLASASAGLTAIFGLFLSLEMGYDPEMLLSHKYSGAAIVFLSVFIYWLQEKSWNSLKVERLAITVGLITLILGGHEGANITHGEGFLSESFTSKTRAYVAFEDAMLFDDLVLPIFEQKCISCHNIRKSKGGLILSSMKALIKGGESGKLFIAGHPETSTLMEKVFLPIDDKEHMPPRGKTQLTSDEIDVFEQWIKHNADVKLKLASLPPSDSLYILGQKLLAKPIQEEVYDFKAAEQKTIDELNDAYRVILPLAQNSPALAVSFYGAKAFSSEKLADLEDLKEQIITLNLNKIPVDDDDLKTIEKFKNLRDLNLNFSEVSGAGLLAMTELKKLNKLSISGVKIEKGEIENLLKKQSAVQRITVWNTGISENDLKALQSKFPEKEIVSGREGLSKMLIQLNEPFIANKSAIFKDSIVLELGHAIKGVDMKISLKNQLVDSLNSQKYEPGKVSIKESKAFTAKAFKKGWLSSEEIVLHVYQNKFEPDTVLLLTKLNNVHPASGAQTFFDKVLGANGANNPAWANNWAGFRTNDMVVILQYDNPVSVSNISLNLLIESQSTIFPPGSIEIWGGNDPNKMRLLTTTRPAQPTESKKGYIQLVNCPIKTFSGKYFKIVAKPLQPVPKWKSKNGRAALFLIDEIFVN